MNVYHPESNTVYCDAHFQVVDEQGHCPHCDAPAALEPPAPSPWVDYHCVQRWWQRVEPAATQADAIASVRLIVMAGRRVSWPTAVDGCAYYAHPDWPRVCVVVRLETNAAV